MKALKKLHIILAFLLLAGAVSSEAFIPAPARAQVAEWGAIASSIQSNTSYFNSIQTVSITITAGTSNTATINAVGANAFLIWGGFTSVGAGTDAATSAPMVVLTNSTTVTATINTSGTVTVKCTVIDPTTNLVTGVQAGTITISGASSTATITSVNTTLSAVFYLGFISTSATQSVYDNHRAVRVDLTNATTVTASQNQSGGTQTASFVVVTFAAAALQSNVQQFSVTKSTLTTNTQAVTSVVAGNSMIAWGGFTDTAAALAGVPWVTLTNATTASLISSTAATYTCNFTVIEFVSGVIQAQRASVNLASATSGTTTIKSVTAANSFVSFLGETGAGTTDATTNSSVVLTNGTTVTGAVNSSASPSIGFEVIEFITTAYASYYFMQAPQQVSITIASGSTSNTATITGVGANAFIIYQGSTCSNTSTARLDSCGGRVTLTNSTTVTANRNSSNSDSLTINAVVIDPTAQLVQSVQFGTINIAASSTSNTATITSVDTTRSAVFYLGQSSTTTAVNNSMTGATLTNATTVTATRGGTAGSPTVSFVVVQFASGVINSLQQFSAAFTSGSTADTQTVTAVTAANTMIAYGGISSASSGIDIAMYWLTLTNTTTVTLTRTATSATSRQPFYTVVEFVSGIFSQTAQRGSIVDASVASNTATITSAATAKTICNYLGQKFANSAAYNEQWIKLTQTDATTLTATKNTAGTTSATVGYEALTFN